MIPKIVPYVFQLSRTFFYSFTCPCEKPRSSSQPVWYWRSCSIVVWKRKRSAVSPVTPASARKNIVRKSEQTHKNETIDVTRTCFKNATTLSRGGAPCGEERQRYDKDKKRLRQAQSVIGGVYGGMFGGVDVACPGLLRWKMIVLPILTTITYTGWENVCFELMGMNCTGNESRSSWMKAFSADIEGDHNFYRTVTMKNEPLPSAAMNIFLVSIELVLFCKHKKEESTIWWIGLMVLLWW